MKMQPQTFLGISVDCLGKMKGLPAIGPDKSPGVSSC